MYVFNLFRLFMCVCVFVCLANSGQWHHYTPTGDGHAKRGHLALNHVKIMSKNVHVLKGFEGDVQGLN